MSGGLEDFSLFDLFRMEAEEQVRVLQQGLIQLESGAATAATLESLMRAAHSIKGAARIVGLDAIVHLTHAVEDRFVAAQHGSALSSAEIDKMLTATDWLARLQGVPEADTAAQVCRECTGDRRPSAATFASHHDAASAPAQPVPSPEVGIGTAKAPEPEPEPEPEDDIFAPQQAGEPQRVGCGTSALRRTASTRYSRWPRRRW